jgi:ADP-heptose:LPS heptosyltransferase
LVAVIEMARVLVGIDSGPTHIAAAVGTPVVALYGPTDPAVTGPQGPDCIVLRREMPCSPCRKPTCADRLCMAAISPEEVVEAAAKLVTGRLRVQG